VRDTGPGIAPDDLPNLFTAFWQREPTDRRGVGLGLWIARAIVEAHGGAIRVANPGEPGARLRFTVPAA
jgi:signal transduction histidine kinase